MMRTNAAAVAVIGLAMSTMSANAQMSGVSHPDQAIDATSDTLPTSAHSMKPSAYGSPLAPAATLQTSPGYTAPAHTATAPVPVAYAAAPAPMPVAVDRPMEHAGIAGDVDANVVTRLEGPSNELPEGTLIKVRLNQTISTDSTRPGTNFDGVLTEAVERDGKVLLPAGTVVQGRVTEVHGGHRISGAASIHLMPTSVTLPDGTHYGMRAQVIDTSMYKQAKVDREGTILRRDHPKETLAILGGVTGSGAVAGAIFGGVPGALIGAGVGAGISTAWWLKQDRQTELPAETKITFALISAMTISM